MKKNVSYPATPADSEVLRSTRPRYTRPNLERLGKWTYRTGASPFGVELPIGIEPGIPRP